MENKMDNEFDFRIGDVVCVFSPKRIEGEIVEVGTCGAHVRQWGWFDYGLLRPGTWEQNFGNLPDLKPKRKVKKWINLFWDNCLGYHRVEYYPSEERAIKDYKRMNEADYLTFKAVSVEIEVDE